MNEIVLAGAGFIVNQDSRGFGGRPLHEALTEKWSIAELSYNAGDCN